MRANVNPAPMTRAGTSRPRPSIHCQLGNVISLRPPIGMGKGTVTVVVSEGSGVAELPPNREGRMMVMMPLPTRMAKIMSQVINDCLFFKSLSPLNSATVRPFAACSEIYYHNYLVATGLHAISTRDPALSPPNGRMTCEKTRFSTPAEYPAASRRARSSAFDGIEI